MSDEISVIVSNSKKGLLSDQTIAKPLALEKLKAGMEDLVTKVGDIIASAKNANSKISLKEVEASVEITAEGGVSLIGTQKPAGGPRLS